VLAQAEDRGFGIVLKLLIQEFCGGFPDQESRLMLDQGIAMGRGGVFPDSDGEQYGRLKR
jgi:hypothetical protein